MHVYYKFGLFLIFILSLRQSYSKAFPDPRSGYNSDTDDYDYNDYYDELSSTSAPEPTKNPNKSIFSKLFDSEYLESRQSFEPELDLPKRSNDEPKCPTVCICRDDNRNVNCSNMGLTAVPRNLPPKVQTLDLSLNRISDLPPTAFANTTRLKDINLSHNLLTKIDKETFSNLPKLDRLSLANNNLTEISPDTFSEATQLSSLNLNNNSIVLPKEGSFLHQPSLHELLLRNCSLTELYDETFGNLSSLRTLKMDGNYFQNTINTKAFEPLKDLIKLKLPELKQDNIFELCNVLKSIDNIGLKRFDVSCYELVSGNSFNESIIFATDPPFITPSTTTTTTTTTTTPAPKPPPKASPAGAAARGKGDRVQTAAVLPNVMTNTHDQSSGNVTADNNETMAGLSTELPLSTARPTTTTEKAYQVPISQEAINYSLISIIIIAVIGLIIGFICRKDVGGIKTKCCRTRKPPPGDQVRPAEEIPLNKIG